jgi:hypothetical protein
LLEREDRGNVEFDPSDLQYNYRVATGEYDDEDDGEYHCLAEVLESEYRLMTVRDYGATHQKFPQAPINYLAQQCLQKNVQEHLLTAMLDLVEPGLLHMERFSKAKGGYVFVNALFDPLLTYNRLSLALTKPYNLRLKFRAVSHLVPLPRDVDADALPTPAPIMNWARVMLHAFVTGEGPRDVTRHDGSSIVSMSLYFYDPILFLTER